MSAKVITQYYSLPLSVTVKKQKENSKTNLAGHTSTTHKPRGQMVAPVSITCWY